MLSVENFRSYLCLLDYIQNLICLMAVLLMLPNQINCSSCLLKETYLQ